MKVLVSSSSLLFTDKPYISSEGYNAFELCSNLIKLDVDMTILAPQTDLDTEFPGRILTPGSTTFKDGVQNSARNWLMYNLALLRTISKIGIGQFDLVHHIFPTGIDVAYSLVPYALDDVPFVYGPILPPATPLPNANTARDSMMRFYVNIFSRRIYRSMLEKAAIIILSVEAVKKYLPMTIRERTKVICHGVPVKEFEGCEGRTRTDSFNVLVLSRLSQEKGIGVVIEAFAKLTQLVPEARLIVAGDGPLRQELIQLSHSRGLDDNIRFVGVVRDQGEKVRLLGMCDAFCHPALRDATPTAVLEAMAAGKAILATSVGGVSEFLDYGRCGILVPPDDVDSLAKALYRLWQDENLRRRFGHRAHIRARKHYDLEIVAKRMKDAYREAADII